MIHSETISYVLALSLSSTDPIFELYFVDFVVADLALPIESSPRLLLSAEKTSCCFDLSG